ncbi:MAG TPA: hypothetical protein DEV73_04475 [Candidatus Zambryskibacteria bacterium]|nr:hypothetical protein [Candidatus Zambryskibacteria bacterium]
MKSTKNNTKIESYIEVLEKISRDRVEASKKETELISKEIIKSVQGKPIEFKSTKDNMGDIDTQYFY